MSNGITTQSAVPSTVPDATPIATFDNGTGGQAQVCAVANQATAIAANTTSDTPIKGSKGTLVAALVTAAGTVDMEIYNHASAGSGTIIGVIPANAPKGSIIRFEMPASAGITVKGNSGNPGVTISFV
jgi:hypothetical protein